MKKLYKSLLTAVIAFCLLHQAFAQTQLKKIERSYKTTKSSSLSIKHSYGEVRIQTWAKNQVDVVVTIEADGYDKSYTDKLVNSVRLEFPNNNDSDLEFSTYYSNKRYTEGRDRIRVNYMIMMPEEIDLEIDHSYGELILDDFAGDYDIEVDYGKVVAGALTGRGEFELQYSKGTVQEITKGDIELSYCDNTVFDKVGDVELEAQYSKLKILEAGDLEVSIRYGNLYVGKAKDLVADIRYAGLTVDKLDGNLDLDGKYCSGKVRINNIQKSFTRIEVEIAYGGAVLTFSEPWPACFQAEEAYGSVTLDKLFNIKIQNKDSFSATYKGTLGKSTDCQREIRAESKYGSVELAVAN